ncbi:Recombination protein RecR [Chlamydiales bacterium SCGC AG-110-M15]|nr:Recombination protein RecR [Chlamydiales bacterium SCGC AG-110-M15]
MSFILYLRTLCVMRYPVPLLQLIERLKKLPGVGTRSAERYAFHLLNWNPSEAQALGDQLNSLHQKIRTCVECGCLSEEEKCVFCSSSNRDTKSICILASPKDAYALEETREYCGLYHVLNTLLSPMEGRSPEDLHLGHLLQRIESLGCKEVIIALDSTLEGDATTLYLQKELARLPIRVSRLAFGLPMGSALEYVDGGTLALALTGRR